MDDLWLARHLGNISSAEDALQGTSVDVAGFATEAETLNDSRTNYGT
jgi:hypothetical protein